MKKLTLIVIIVVTFAAGLHLGAQNEMHTHKAYIASLNLQGK